MFVKIEADSKTTNYMKTEERHIENSFICGK